MEKRLLFIDLLPSALEPEVMIYIADLEKGSIVQALGGEAAATNFSQPRWSPDGNWIAVGLRPTNSTANKALWVLKIDGSKAISVTDEPSASFFFLSVGALGKTSGLSAAQLTTWRHRYGYGIWKLEKINAT